jgi:hypothetical protein
MAFNEAVSNFQTTKTRYAFIKAFGNKKTGRTTSISSSRKQNIISKRNTLLQEYESKVLPSSQTQFKYFRKLSNDPIFHPTKIPAT